MSATVSETDDVETFFEHRCEIRRHDTTMVDLKVCHSDTERLSQWSTISIPRSRLAAVAESLGRIPVVDERPIWEWADEAEMSAIMKNSEGRGFTREEYLRYYHLEDSMRLDLGTPVKYRIKDPKGAEAFIERCESGPSEERWAVRFEGDVMALDGHWEWEPLPSSRNQKWLENHRFDTAENAADAFLECGEGDR